jgi:hypothetical protein
MNRKCKLTNLIFFDKDKQNNNLNKLILRLLLKNRENLI